jgi:hypothetical protein
MFQVFYLKDESHSFPGDHDLILDGYNMEIYQYLMPLFPYRDTVKVLGMEFTGARISLNQQSFLEFIKFIRRYPHEFHIVYINQF